MSFLFEVRKRRQAQLSKRKNLLPTKLINVINLRSVSNANKRTRLSVGNLEAIYRGTSPTHLFIEIHSIRSVITCCVFFYVS